jgi:hypothetical protein
MTAIPHVRVEGTSLQRGRQYGAQARDRVRRSVQEYRQVFAYYAGWDWETVRREAARFEAPIADFRPAYWLCQSQLAPLFSFDVAPCGMSRRWAVAL